MNILWYLARSMYIATAISTRATKLANQRSWYRPSLKLPCRPLHTSGLYLLQLASKHRASAIASEKITKEHLWNNRFYIQSDLGMKRSLSVPSFSSCPITRFFVNQKEMQFVAINGVQLFWDYSALSWLVYVVFTWLRMLHCYTTSQQSYWTGIFNITGIDMQSCSNPKAISNHLLLLALIWLGFTAEVFHCWLPP